MLEFPSEPPESEPPVPPFVSPEPQQPPPPETGHPLPPEGQPAVPLEATPRGKRWLIPAAVILATGVGFSGGTWLARREEGLSVELAKTRERLQALEKQEVLLKEKQETLEKQNSQLSDASRALKEEKDKLTIETQATQSTLKAQINSLTEERHRLVGGVKHLTRDNQALNTKAQLLEQQAAVLQQSNERLTIQRDAIQRQLAKTEKHSKAIELQRQLIERQKEADELKKAYKATEKKARSVEEKEKKTLAELEKAKARLQQLQQGYTGLVTENAHFREQVNKAPEEVTRLARQHERLAREAATMHYNLGVILSKQKEYVKAAREFQKVIELRPDDADAHYNLGVIYAEHLPNRNKAIACFRKYLQLNPHAQDASWVKQYIATWQAWEGKERLD